MSDGPTVVPEPEVKATLRALGVSVPKGVTGTDIPDVTALHAPLVLKAFGPGHRPQDRPRRGAPRPRPRDPARRRRRHARQACERQGITPDGFLVEEQCDADDGVELIVGVVRREPFGLVVALGLGGTVTELLDLVALRMAPAR